MFIIIQILKRNLNTHRTPAQTCLIMHFFKCSMLCSKLYVKGYKLEKYKLTLYSYTRNEVRSDARRVYIPTLHACIVLTSNRPIVLIV